MRRKAAAETRTTLLIPQRGLWTWAKEESARRGHASASELLFELLQEDRSRREWEPLLQALERRFELVQYTLGRCADEAGVPKPSIVRFLEDLGIGTDPSSPDAGRRKIHNLLEQRGGVLRERRLIASLRATHLHGIALAAAVFETHHQFVTELEIHYGVLLNLIGQDAQLRSLLDSTFGGSNRKALRELPTILAPGEHLRDLGGPRDWREALLYWSAVRAFASQWRILRDHFATDLSALQLIARRSDDLFSDAPQIWAAIVHSPEFQRLHERFVRPVAADFESPFGFVTADPTEPVRSGRVVRSSEAEYVELSALAEASMETPAAAAGAVHAPAGVPGWPLSEDSERSEELRELVREARAHGLRIKSFTEVTMEAHADGEPPGGGS